VNGPAIEVEHLAKRFRVYHERNQTLKAAFMRRRRAVYEEFWALDDVSFDIPAGTSFGLVGDNGSGKSTLLKTLAKILFPDRGEVRVNGRMAAMLEVGSGFHPELSGRDNIYLNGSILGMTRAEIDRKFDDIVQFSGVEAFIDQPVKNYSSGMYVRLGFSVAIHVDPEILLVDEVLAVGDAAFQQQCAEKFAQFRRDGRTVVIVTHDMSAVRTMCDHAAWLSHGKLVELGPAPLVVERYRDATRTDQYVDPEGHVRWGSGEAVVERIELLHGDRPITEVAAGDDLTIRLHYMAKEPIDQPVFGLAIEAADGAYLWANNTRDSGFDIPRIDGSGVVECRVPRLAFQPGGYTVLASVVDSSTTHVFDYVRNAADVRVVQGAVTESGGYVQLDGTWRAVSSDGVL
jgi:ABC-2 type transport system ATP-binding protein